jgi:hypothetical protein
MQAVHSGDILKRHSGAADVIVVHHADQARYVCSDFHVHVGRCVAAHSAALGPTEGAPFAVARER